MQTSQRRSESLKPSQIVHANLRIFVSEVRADIRSIPVDARRTVSRMSEGALPLAKVGTREGETFAWHGRGSDFQGLGILQHRLSERIIQGGCPKGICAEGIRRRRQTLKNRADKNFFVWPDQDSREEIGKRIGLMF